MILGWRNSSKVDQWVEFSSLTGIWVRPSEPGPRRSAESSIKSELVHEK